MAKRTKNTQATHGKKTDKIKSDHNKKTIQNACSSDNALQQWDFSKLDVGGEFAFNVLSQDMNHKLILTKILDFSKRTWAEIKRDTHDAKNKSAHHFLEFNSLSKEAKQRILFLGLENDTDSIFSMRLNNIVRIIGIRDKEKFIVKWYDSQHKFCPSKK